MADIFFIASDERVLDLIESLRIQSPRSLTFETDLPSAISRVPKENPRYVFIQSSLDGVPCEEIATRIKELVAGHPPQLVLLSDEESPPTTPAIFDRSVSLALTTQELTNEVMLLLSGQEPSEVVAFPSAISDLFTLEDPTDFNIPAFEEADFEPHLAPLWQPDRSERPLVFDSITPDDGAAAPTAKPMGARHRQIDAAPADEIVFFVPEPVPVAEAEPPGQAAPPASPPPVEDVWTGGAGKGPKGLPRSLYPGPEQIYRKPPQLCGQPEEDEQTDAGETSVPAPRPIGRYAAVLVVLVLAAGALLWQRSISSGPETSPRTPLAPSASLAKPPAAPAAPAASAVKPPSTAANSDRGLPGFIPDVPADPAYAAAHPGWESYPGEEMQFRVFREKGIIKAIQVVSEASAGISESLVKASFKEVTGIDLPAAGRVKEENGVNVDTRRAKDGTEAAIYRSGEDRRILGFVFQFPHR